MMCPNCGTPKNNKFSIWNKWKIYYFLSVPILKHIRVFKGNHPNPSPIQILKASNCYCITASMPLLPNMLPLNSNPCLSFSIVMIGVKLVQFYSCPVIQNMLGQSEALYPSPNQIARKINSGAATAEAILKKLYVCCAPTHYFWGG